jgi:hypothetical protein
MAPGTPHRSWGLATIAVVLFLCIAAAAAALAAVNADQTSGAAGRTPVELDAVDPPSTTQSTTTAATTAAPTPVAPVDEAPGLRCADLAGKGYSYPEAVRYWRDEGFPSRMDASGTWIPCQTVYPAAEVQQYWKPANDATVGFNRPAMWGYPDGIEYFRSYGLPASLAADLEAISEATAVQWTEEMLVALGSSYCNDWDREEYEEDSVRISTRGAADWSTVMAAALSIPVKAALTAIESKIWTNYQSICE